MELGVRCSLNLQTCCGKDTMICLGICLNKPNSNRRSTFSNVSFISPISCVRDTPWAVTSLHLVRGCPINGGGPRTKNRAFPTKYSGVTRRCSLGGLASSSVNPLPYHKPLALDPNFNQFSLAVLATLKVITRPTFPGKKRTLISPFHFVSIGPPRSRPTCPIFTKATGPCR